MDYVTGPHPVHIKTSPLISLLFPFLVQELASAQTAAAVAQETLSRTAAELSSARERLGRAEGEATALKRRLLELEVLLDEVGGTEMFGGALSAICL